MRHLQRGGKPAERCAFQQHVCKHHPTVELFFCQPHGTTSFGPFSSSTWHTIGQTAAQLLLHSQTVDVSRIRKNDQYRTVVFLQYQLAYLVETRYKLGPSFSAVNRCAWSLNRFFLYPRRCRKRWTETCMWVRLCVRVRLLLVHVRVDVCV